MTRKRIAVIALTAAAIVLPASPSAATTGPAFGQHVADCAKTMGFSGAHNPGMHQGALGWDGMTC